MNDFTPWSSLAGGALIGVAASLLLVASGRLAGISGIVAGLLVGERGDRPWRAFFLAGLLLAGLAIALSAPSAIAPSPRALGWLAVSGLLVGAGTRLGNGCTSGHGVCGISRLSRRALVATATFVATGVATVAVARWLGSGS